MSNATAPRRPPLDDLERLCRITPHPAPTPVASFPPPCQCQSRDMYVLAGPGAVKQHLRVGRPGHGRCQCLQAVTVSARRDNLRIGWQCAEGLGRTRTVGGAIVRIMWCRKCTGRVGSRNPRGKARSICLENQSETRKGPSGKSARRWAERRRRYRSPGCPLRLALTAAL